VRASRARAALALAATLAAPAARGDVPLPPWVGDGEVPPPPWAQSVVPKPGERGEPGDLVLFAEPSRASDRRGVTEPGASLPFFGTARGSGCSGSWWLVGPFAWTCSDDGGLSPASPAVPVAKVDASGLSVEYEFVRSGGTSAYRSLDSAEEGEADEELEAGWAVAVVETLESKGRRWGRTTKGVFIAQRDLIPAHPSAFRGEVVDGGRLDFAWVLSERASVWPTASSKDKPADARARFQRVFIREQVGPMVRVDTGAWMLARDLARPTDAPAPIELRDPGERWIDVDTATQTLVAYEGAIPVYATLVSTGRGGDAASATPAGVHRVWVKILASDMSNIEHEDRDAPHYALEDVPYVQFFDGAVALHGTYWHGDFGHARSHGCVNLSPLDARWLFAFSGPHVPAGWAAAYPTPMDQGTVVRVR
jgi:lipoprotein-anchoring transpeptidase ErfK/SrfK